MRNNTKSPAEIVGSIDDLLTEIMLRLPIKSLVHFKLLSKHWHSLITNPRFIRRRRNPDHNPAVGLFFPTTNDYVFEYLPFYPTDLRKHKDPFSSSIKILSSCNGLLLCESTCNTKDCFVYNPTTNQYSNALPKSPGKIQGMSLAFDPAKSHDHYKVVCVRRVKPITHSWEYQYQIEIYSTETPGAWRSSVVRPFTAYVDFANGVYWNGAINWLNHDVIDRDSLYFNIHQDVLGDMPNPPMHHIYRNGRRNYYYGESCDHLHYIQIYRSETQFKIYEMKRDYSEWFVKYHVDLSLLISANTRMLPPEMNWKLGYWYFYAFCILSVVRGDQEEEDASYLVL